MKFSQTFFSTEKIIIPILFAIGIGGFVMLLTMVLNKEVDRRIVFALMSMGFVVGNIYKTQKLMDELERKDINKGGNLNV